MTLNTFAKTVLFVAGLGSISAMACPSPGGQNSVTLNYGKETSTDSTALDQQLAAQVTNILRTDSRLSGHISVCSRNGAISLSGDLATVPMIYRAVELVRRIPQVTSVDATKLNS